MATGGKTNKCPKIEGTGCLTMRPWASFSDWVRFMMRAKLIETIKSPSNIST
ncbi:MAG: hypothetical protein WA624_22080 [Methylocella sp.]